MWNTDCNHYHRSIYCREDNVSLMIELNIDVTIIYQLKKKCDEKNAELESCKLLYNIIIRKKIICG